MKTKELRKRLPVLCDEHNLQWNETKGEFTVGNSEGTVIAYVDKVYLAEITTRTTEFNRLNDTTKVELFKLLTEYALTPLAEREEEKKYYLKWAYRGIKAIDGLERDLYLNYNTTYDKYNLEISNYETYDFKVKFTDKEIENLPLDIKILILSDFLVKEPVEEE